MDSPVLLGVLVATATLLVADFGRAMMAGVACFYGWFILAFIPRFHRAVTIDDPDLALSFFNDEEPVLPMVVFAIAFGSGYGIYLLFELPFLPAPGEPMSWSGLVVAAIAALVWFTFSSFVSIFSIVLVVDGCRRLLGREGLRWFPEEE